jgi:hypothetical protein
VLSLFLYPRALDLLIQCCDVSSIPAGGWTVWLLQQQGPQNICRIVQEAPSVVALKLVVKLALTALECLVDAYPDILRKRLQSGIDFAFQIRDESYVLSRLRQR